MASPPLPVIRTRPETLGVSIEIENNAELYSFFSMYGTQVHVVTGAVNILSMTCRLVHDFMSKHEVKAESDAVLAHLREIVVEQKRLGDGVLDQARHMKDMNTNVTTFSAVADARLLAIQQQQHTDTELVLKEVAASSTSTTSDVNAVLTSSLATLQRQQKLDMDTISNHIIQNTSQLLDTQTGADSTSRKVELETLSTSIKSELSTLQTTVSTQHADTKKEFGYLQTDMNKLDARLDIGNQHRELELATFQSAIDGISTRVVKEINAQLADILMAITTASSQLDIDTIKAQMLASVQSVLEMGNAATSEHMKQLEEDLKQLFACGLSAPLEKLHEALGESLSNLSADISNKLESTSASQHEDTSQLLKLCQKLETAANESRTQISDVKSTILTAAETLPYRTKDKLSSLFDKLNDRGHAVQSAINAVRDKCDTIKSDVYNVGKDVNQLSSARIKTDASSSLKGGESEVTMYELLSSKLSSHEGYSVTRCGSEVASCDILVRRHSYPSIRIENKAVGKSNAQSVKLQDVEKFERDLKKTGDHGILCSHYSGISGRSNFELVQLMGTGRWSIYLTHLDYNVDDVEAAIHIIYKLDAATCNQPGKTISLHALEQIQNIIKEHKAKIAKLKKWMQEGMNNLKGLELSDFDRVLQSVIQGGVVPSDATSAPTAPAPPPATSAPTAPAPPPATVNISPHTNSTVSNVTVTLNVPPTALAAATPEPAAATQIPPAPAIAATQATPTTIKRPPVANVQSSEPPGMPATLGQLLWKLDHLRPTHVRDDDWYRTRDCLRHVAALAGLRLESTDEELSQQKGVHLGRLAVRLTMSSGGAPYGITLNSLFRNAFVEMRRQFKYRHATPAEQIAALTSRHG